MTHRPARLFATNQCRLAAQSCGKTMVRDNYFCHRGQLRLLR
jgi:hypothetical protein